MLNLLKTTLRGTAVTAMLLAAYAGPVQAEESLALASNADEATTPAVASETPTQAGEMNVVDASTIAPAAQSPQAQEVVTPTASVGDAAEKAQRETRRAEINSKVRNPTLQKHLLENIDVFGKSELPAIYILGPGIEDFEGQLLTRDFMRDPFFMQNVDREEFEMKMWLRGDLDEDFKKNQEEKKKP